jgi:hypothetical protein
MLDLNLVHRGVNRDPDRRRCIMSDLPFPWCVYAEHQTKAGSCGRVTDRSWGIENGLNKFLTVVTSGSVPENQTEFRSAINRAVSTGSWVERNHARLGRKFLRPSRGYAERPALARARLAEIRKSVSTAEWGLLIAVAAGVGYHEMAGLTAGSARTRVARLRARLRTAAGQVRP